MTAPVMTVHKMAKVEYHANPDCPNCNGNGYLTEFEPWGDTVVYSGGCDCHCLTAVITFVEPTEEAFKTAVQEWRFNRDHYES